MQIAEKLAKEQKRISISEFFEKNRHLLGYDNKIKALLMIVKEACDNSLDACEEVRILPEIYVKIEELEKEKYKILVKDNGPGIVKKQIPKIFGILLYGSKFHRLKQNRGQQGLGISCGVLYSQLTTGEPIEILSSTGDGKTHKYRLKIDVKRNEPQILNSEVLEGKEWHGVQISFTAEGLYREHQQSVLEYLKEVAISNPYAHIIFDSPNGRLEFQRGSESLPAEPKEIKPHLHGVELGVLARMLHSTRANTIAGFLVKEFSRVGTLTAKQICAQANIDPKISPRRVTDEEVKRLVNVIKEVKLTKPPTDCLSPLGKELIESGLKKELNPEFVAAISRPPAVYRGWPFEVEVGIAFGGSIQGPKIMRFANRVPLLYKQGDCVITKAMQQIDWRRYGVEADKLPIGPVVIFVHICSVWVPFTSESKEAIASYPIILKETKLALQECARKLYLYLSGVRKAQLIAERKSIFERYAYETAKALEELTDEDAKKIEEEIKKIVEKNIGDIRKVIKDEKEKNNSEKSEESK